MKKFITFTVVLAVGCFTIWAATVEVKFSGPSGQGKIIYWAPSTGTTNLVMGANGIEVANGNGSGWTNLDLTTSSQYTTITGDTAIVAASKVVVTNSAAAVAADKVIVTNAVAGLTSVVGTYTNAQATFTNIYNAAGALISHNP